MKRSWSKEAGANLVEYALVVALIALIASGAVQTVVPAFVGGALCGEGKVYEALSIDSETGRSDYLTFWMPIGNGSSNWECGVLDSNYNYLTIDRDGIHN